MMYRILFITLLFTHFIAVQSQQQIVSDTILKIGIYKNFHEFKTNSPSIEFNYDILTKDEGYGFLNLSGNVAIYRIDIEKKKGKDIGNIFGFCDGKHIYINEGNPTLEPRTDFRRIEYLGVYCYFESVYRTFIYTGSGINSTFHIDRKVIDMNTGKVTSLNKSTLREIMANDKELLDEFNNELWKNRKLKEYMIRYLKRRKAKAE